VSGSPKLFVRTRLVQRVRDEADVEGAEIREKRLAFAVAGEMNEIFDLARASSRTNSSAGPEPTNELGARRRGDLRQSGFRGFR
jgi:hypothetical protein